MSEFAGMKPDLEAPHQRFGARRAARGDYYGNCGLPLVGVGTAFGGHRGTAAVHGAAQAVMQAVFVGMFAAIVGTVIILKNMGVMP